MMRVVKAVVEAGHAGGSCRWVGGGYLDDVDDCSGSAVISRGEGRRVGKGVCE